jgi:hypothetical protein
MYTLRAEKRSPSDKEKIVIRATAAGTNKRFAENGKTPIRAITASNNPSWIRKLNPLPKNAAKGKSSLGRWTFFTSPELLIMDEVEEEIVSLNKPQIAKPENIKMTKSGIDRDAPRNFPIAM